MSINPHAVYDDEDQQQVPETLDTLSETYQNDSPEQESEEEDSTIPQKPRKIILSRQDILKYTHLRQSEAAKKLGVSVSTLKRRQKEFGIAWSSSASTRTRESRKRKRTNDSTNSTTDSNTNSDSRRNKITPPNEIPSQSTSIPLLPKDFLEYSEFMQRFEENMRLGRFQNYSNSVLPNFSNSPPTSRVMPINSTDSFLPTPYPFPSYQFLNFSGAMPTPIANGHHHQGFHHQQYQQYPQHHYSQTNLFQPTSSSTLPNHLNYTTLYDQSNSTQILPGGQSTTTPVLDHSSQVLDHDDTTSNNDSS